MRRSDHRESVVASVEQFLIPTLVPGDVVIPDTLGSHKGQAVRAAIRSAAAALCDPTGSDQRSGRCRFPQHLDQ
jgi:hypothetical protein